MTETQEMKTKLDRVINELSVLSDDNYWAYTKEYWRGLLDGALVLLKKVQEEL